MRVSHLCVDDFVPAQCAGLSEAFPAHFADEGPRAGVHRHVSGQIIMGVKNLQIEYTHTARRLIYKRK